MKEQFLKLLLTSHALRFGEFKTKSGRLSPFFINTGAFDHGAVLASVASCYSDLVQSNFGPLARLHLYGPAYKGIPLATAVSIELASRTHTDVCFTYNRKERKDHGEGGVFVGREITKGTSVLIVEDVLTGGTSVRESLELLRSVGANARAVIVGVDREERGSSQKSAKREIEEDFNVPVHAILTISEIVDRLYGNEIEGRVWIGGDTYQRIQSYRAQYCS
jgi:orotate phosphoribosyltransferase